MKTFGIKTMIAALAVLLFVQNPATGCTGIMLKTKDGSTVHGRTLEFAVEVKTDVVVIPRNYQFTGLTANGDGLKYTSKYAVTGAITFGVKLVADGMNEMGLTSGAFFFPDFAEYAPLTNENQRKALSPLDFNNWILTQFATIDEIKKAIENNEVVIVATVLEGWGAEAPPFHYIVYDKTGKSIVIEPIGGKLIVYDNPLGVLTNSPTFDWHLINLRNYVNLTPNNVREIKIDGETFKGLGQGTGMMGIPGDFTPPSRFVRAMAFCMTAIPAPDATEGINQVFHILNNFDIPVGFSRTVENGTVYADYTQFTCARDPQSLKYYYKSYTDQNIKVVDLKSFDFNADKIMIFNTSSEQKYEDVSKRFAPE